MLKKEFDDYFEELELKLENKREVSIATGFLLINI